jgi:hypothetical protein
MFDDLPRDVLPLVFGNLNCDDILLLYEISRKFYDIVKSKDVYKIRKHNGYPRPEGQCKTHDISLIFNLCCSDSVWGFEFNDDVSYRRIVFDKILCILQQQNTDLVRGDLIVRLPIVNVNMGIYIFDGHKITDLPFYIDEYPRKSSPKYLSFNSVLTKKYWPSRFTYLTRYHWLNINLLREQLLANIVYHDDILYSTFIINTISYTLVYEITDHYSCRPRFALDEVKDTNDFRKILSTHDMLLIVNNDDNRKYDDFTFGLMSFMYYYCETSGDAL